MRGQNILADQVHRRRPQAVETRLVQATNSRTTNCVCLIAGRSEIVEQRVKPNIAHYIPIIKGQGDTPTQALDGSRDAQIQALQTIYLHCPHCTPIAHRGQASMRCMM